jgi:helix-turn-helix, Psq domain
MKFYYEVCRDEFYALSKNVWHFADLAKGERIEKALFDFTQENGLTVLQAAKLYKIAPSTIQRRLAGYTTSRKAIAQYQHLLTSAEEETVVK